MSMASKALADNMRGVAVHINACRVFREYSLTGRKNAVNKSGYSPLTTVSVTRQNYIKVAL